MKNAVVVFINNKMEKKNLSNEFVSPEEEAANSNVYNNVEWFSATM